METLSAALGGFLRRTEYETPSIGSCWFDREEGLFYFKQGVLALVQIHCETPIIKILSPTFCHSFPPSKRHASAEFKDLFPVT